MIDSRGKCHGLLYVLLMDRLPQSPEDPVVVVVVVVVLMPILQMGKRSHRACMWQAGIQTQTGWLQTLCPADSAVLCLGGRTAGNDGAEPCRELATAGRTQKAFHLDHFSLTSKPLATYLVCNSMAGDSCFQCII